MGKIALAILVVGVLGVAAYLYTDARDRAAAAERQNEAAYRRDFAEWQKLLVDCTVLAAKNCPPDGRMNVECSTAAAKKCNDLLAPRLKELQEHYGVVVE